MSAVHDPDLQPPVRAIVRNPGPAPDLADHPVAATPVTAVDPRLTHAGGGLDTLLHLQRSAGNAAVASLVAGAPGVQREAGDDDASAVTGTTAPTGGATTPAGSSAGTGPGGPVTSDGANTTITGAHISLDAAMTEASGVLRADTIIADNVIASSYTPGAGNVM
jgi:hypothetical protein